MSTPAPPNFGGLLYPPDNKYRKNHRRWPWLILAAVVAIAVGAVLAQQTLAPTQQAGKGGAAPAATAPSRTTSHAATPTSHASTPRSTPATTPSSVQAESSSASAAAASSAHAASSSASAASAAAAASVAAAKASAAVAAPPVGTAVPIGWSNLVHTGNGVATVNSAEWSTTPPYFGELKYGTALILDVTIESTEGTILTSPFYWQARDADGRTYTWVFAPNKEPELATGDVVAGSKSRGFVTIDAPQVPVTVQLVDVDLSILASWSVP